MPVTYRKKKMVKKPTAVRSIARQEAKKAIARELETKNFYGRQNSFGVSYSGSVFPITLNPNVPVYLIQGPTKSDYIGDTISPLSVAINYQCVLAAGTASTAVYNMRVMLIQVKGGGTPAAANVLQSVGNYLTPYSYPDANYAETFTILYSKLHRISAQDTWSVNGSIYVPAKKLKKIHMLANTAANITANGIYLLAYSDSGLSTAVFLAYQSKLAFKDA